jgi:hypothetical protein
VGVSSVAPSRAKYGNQRVEIDGHKFASKKEARRYQELRLLERAGEIVSLKLQPRFDLYVKDQKVCAYVGDFSYFRGGKQLVVEDAKGFKTDVYKLKRKLMKACHNIEVVEV